MTPTTLRAERMRRGWTQHQLGVALGYTEESARSAISRLERGERIAQGMQARLRELFAQQQDETGR